jgi:hypothetical protein
MVSSSQAMTGIITTETQPHKNAAQSGKPVTTLKRNNGGESMIMTISVSPGTRKHPMPRIRLKLLLPVFALLLGACTTLPTPRDSTPVSGGVSVATGPRGTTVSAVITAGEARQLAVANRLTGYRSLPPGIARNLARGKPLPPGINRRLVPGNMRGQLPQITGHEWRIAGKDLILVALATAVVVEILQDVFE